MNSVAPGDRRNTIFITLPAGGETQPLLAAVVRAVLARVEGLSNPDELADIFLALAAEPLAQATAAPAQPGGAMAATLAIEEDPRRLTLEIAGAWRHTEPLPALPAGPSARDEGLVEEAAAGAGLGVGLLLVRRLMDEVAYSSQAGENRWTLAKSLPEAPGMPGTPAESLVVTFNLPATYRYLNVPAACVEALLAAVPLPAEDPRAYEIQLALQETLLNIVDHAYGPGSDVESPRIDVTLTLDRGAGRFVAETCDDGLAAADLAAADLATLPGTLEVPQPRASLISGSALLFVSATLVNAGNYLFNLLLGRWLGPAAFADLSLVVTLFLVTSFITAGLQMPTARFAALFGADRDVGGIADLRRWATRLAAGLGGVLLALFALGAPLWAHFFSTASLLPFVIFGLFVPFYLVQGVDRGVLQGRTNFRWLAVTYQTEMWSRLILSLAFVAVGWAVNGAVVGIGLSFVAAWLVARRVGADLPSAKPLAPQVRREVLVFVGPVLVAQLGQILINNSDVLIVRHFFPAVAAGHYAALALTGRIVFFATWSVVTAMFPIVAQRHRRGEAHRSLLFVSLGVVLVVSLAIVAVTYLFPNQIVGLLFGSAYLSIAPLLWLYALATMFYALANVVINYRLSIGSTGGTYLAIAAGVAQVALLWMFHATLSQVVWVQLLLMAGLFVVLLAWDFVRHESRVMRHS